MARPTSDDLPPASPAQGPAPAGMPPTVSFDDPQATDLYRPGRGALPEPPVASSQPPPDVPGYAIEGVLGRGGMGVVYKARHLALKRTVALKMILAGGHASAKELARFKAEAEAMARLQHPNIVQIFEVGEHQGVPYFALEYAESGSLAQKLRGAPLPTSEAAHLVEMLARAVDAAHQQGIVHRDLKPHNVLLSREGTPKLTDFGLAKCLDGAGQTQTGAVLGTPSYMAPEQAAGTQAVGPTADTYALGAILYELLTGRPPFRAVTPLDTVRQVLSEEPVPPSRLQPRLPRDLETVCLKCLEKDPLKRYGSATALAEDLGRFLKGEPVQARPAGRWERAWRWARRKPATAALLAVSALAVLAGVAAAVGLFYSTRLQQQRDAAEILRGRAEEQGQLARQQRTEAEKQRGLAEARRIDAEKQRGLVRRLLYLSRINMADRAWQDGQVARMEELLREQVPRAGEEDQRGFEWYYLWRLRHGNQPLTLEGHRGEVTSVAFSPDGRRLASASGDKTVRVWDLQTRTEALTFRGHTKGVTSVAFSPDGRRLASASGDKTVRVWDLQTRKEALTLKGHTHPVTCIAYSPDGQRLASAGGEFVKLGEVKVWNLRTGKEVLSLKGHTCMVYGVAYSPDGRRLASAAGGFDLNKMQFYGEAKVWDAQTGKEILSLKGHANQVTDIAYSPDGQRLASSSLDKTVKVWDAQTGKEILTLKGHTFYVAGVTYSPDGQRLASSSNDKTVRVWDAKTGKEVFAKGHTDLLGKVVFSPDGQRLACGSSDKTVRVWDAQVAKKALTLAGRTGLILRMAFSPDGLRLACATSDPTVKVWDAQTGKEVLSLNGHTDAVSGVAYSPDGKRLASASRDMTVRLWDLQTGKEVLTLKGHTGPVSGMAFSPDGRRLASASGDGTVKVWDLQTGKEIPTFKVHTGAFVGVAFSPDGKRLAGISFANTMERASVKVWNLQSGEALSLKGHTSFILGVAFSPDGRRLASASGDQTVRVWDLQTGKETLTLKGHANAVSSISFSPDGRRLATASPDLAVKIWDAETGQEALTLQGHTNTVTSVAFSPDGRRLASAGYRTVKVWNATPWP